MVGCFRLGALEKLEQRGEDLGHRASRCEGPEVGSAGFQGGRALLGSHGATCVDGREPWT